MADGLSRRVFLARLLAGAGCLLVARGDSRGPDRGATPEALAARIVSLVPDRRQAAVLGRAYLREAPAEASVAGLVAAISTGCVPDFGSHAGSEAGLRRALSARIRRDYAERRVVDVRGWLLSPTEARICALATLTA